MWEVNLKAVVLLEGFKVYEDATFVYLKFRGVEVARFTHNTLPEDIEREARKYAIEVLGWNIEQKEVRNNV